LPACLPSRFNDIYLKTGAFCRLKIPKKIKKMPINTAWPKPEERNRFRRKIT
jgi:hypothetical protein